jgi:hypothetical protein
VARVLNPALDVDITSPRIRAQIIALRLQPLWRHAAWGSALFAVLLVAAAVRLDVQSVRKDLDRNERAQREARVSRDRLRLEIDARRRTAVVDALATQMQLGPAAQVVRLEVP